MCQEVWTPHATVDSVMRDKVILATAMPTMTVTVLDEYEDLLGDCHALIVLPRRYSTYAILLGCLRVHGYIGNNRTWTVSTRANCVRSHMR